MKKCPYCNAQIEDGSLFCEVCGKQQPQGKVCPHCGTAINDGDMFCQGCGASTVGAPPAASPPQVEQEANSAGMKQPNQKNSSTGNALLFVIIGIFLFVALFLGAGWLYYSKYQKQRSVELVDVELASLAELPGGSLAELPEKELHSEENAEESIKKRVEEIFAKAYNGEGGYDSGLLSTEFSQALIYDYEHYDEIPDNYMPYMDHGLWDQAQDCENPHITVKSVSKLSKQTASAEILIHCFNDEGRPFTIMLVLEDGEWKVDDFIDNEYGASEKEGLLNDLRENFNYKPTHK